MEILNALLKTMGISSRGTSGGSASRHEKLLFVATRASLGAMKKLAQDGDVLGHLGVGNGQQIHEIHGSGPYELLGKIRGLVEGMPSRPDGVVVVGDYATFPSRSVFCGKGGREGDDGLVWSDDIYGALGDTLLPTVPVSRVPILPSRPNSKPTKTHAEGLKADDFTFGPAIFGALVRRGRDGALTSFPLPVGETVPDAVQTAEKLSQAGRLYVLLHGTFGVAISLLDDAGGNVVIGKEVFKDESWTSEAVVFSGSCWGGLLASRPNLFFSDPPEKTYRTLKDSFALGMLVRGAPAFVGFTAHHWLATDKKHPEWGGELHRYFWEGVECCGLAPAPALFRAKARYVESFARSNPNPEPGDLRRFLKNLWSAQCFGVGW